MLDFEFYNPTRIVFGQNRLDELNRLVPVNAKVMITYGGESAKRYGTIEKVRDALGTRKIIEFGGIEANPEYETLLKAVDVVKQEDIDFLLAVGGGSVMDGTKFIALASLKEGSLESLLFNGFEPAPVEKALPFGCVVTLPATGSEMNSNCVVTYQQQKYVVASPFAFPQFSFLDPELTKTLPKTQIANGVVDAFVHVLEQYMTYPVNAKVQDRFAEGILRTLIEEGPITYDDSQNLQARKNFIWAASNALNGLLAMGVPQDWSTHLIGHELTTQFGIAHGRTLAIVLPSLLRERKDKKREKLLQYAERVWDIREGNDDERIEQAIVNTETFFHSLNVDTKLSDYELGDEAIESIIAGLEKLNLVALSETQDLTLDIVRTILKKAM